MNRPFAGLTADSAPAAAQPLLARHSRGRDYYLIEGARSWTVSDPLMKKEFILQGMGWGHMPTFLIADEVRDGRLLSIAGRHLRGGTGEIVAARRSDRPHGPIANRLWHYIENAAPSLRAAVRKHDLGRNAGPFRRGL